jgi:hypothetical protein
MNCQTSALESCPTSTRRAKESDGEGKQHEDANCIDCYVYRTGHWEITQLITIGSDDGVNDGRTVGLPRPRGRAAPASPALAPIGRHSAAGFLDGPI